MTSSSLVSIPQRVQIEDKPLASGHLVDRALGGRDRVRVAASLTKLEDLEGADRGIHDPVEPYAEGGVLTHLLDAVAARVRRARRDDLDHDVGWDGDEAAALRSATRKVDIGI